MEDRRFKEAILELIKMYSKSTLYNMRLEFHYDEEPDVTIRMEFFPKQ